ncbi:hypothetical protein ACK280_27420 [Mycobacterium sherrisii]|uniref:hypothetical protein n=1 Tax=Mycobacterium sherrisii TaxID=243061 RepID=UPI00397532ED
MGTYDPERHDPELAKDSGEAALAQAKVVFEELQDRFFAQVASSRVVYESDLISGTGVS